MRKTYLLIVSMILISIILVGCQSNTNIEGSNDDSKGSNADVEASNANVDVSNVLLSKINISNSKGFGTVNTDFFAVYEDEPTLETLQNAFTNAVMVAGMVDMMEPEYDLEFINTDNIEAIIDSVIRANQNLNESLNANDFEMIGKDLTRLQAIINQLQVVRENELELKKQQDSEDVVDTDKIENVNVVDTNTVTNARSLNNSNVVTNTTNSVR